MKQNISLFFVVCVGAVLLGPGCVKKNPFVREVEPSIHWTDEDEAGTKEETVEEVKDAVTVSPTKDDETPGMVEFDRIEAIIEGPVDIEKVSTSDVKRRGFDGGNHTLDDIIDERLRDQRGNELKIEVNDDDINRYLMQLSNGAPMDKEYLSNVARAHGYTLDEFYDELKRLYRSNQVLDYDVHSRMDIPEGDINKYYEDNPIMEEAVYYIQTTYVPWEEGKTEQQQYRELNDPKLRAGKQFEWTIPVDLKESEIEEDQEFILKMKKGHIHVVQDVDGFTLYKLHDYMPQKAQKLEKRKQDILNELREKRFHELIADLKKDLREQAHVYYMNEDKKN